jgi:hypothetical protein
MNLYHVNGDNLSLMPRRFNVTAALRLDSSMKIKRDSC